MGWLGNLFGNSDDNDLVEADKLYNELMQADVSVSALEDVERQMSEKGLKPHWDYETQSFYFIEE